MFPPHTRGCTLIHVSSSSKHQVSPAHAGMYRHVSKCGGLDRRFPRTRGDVPYEFSKSHRAKWFPPHTRGCT